MKTRIAILTLIALGAVGMGLLALTRTRSAGAQEEHGRREGREREHSAKSDADLLHELVRQARADLDTLREIAGLPKKRREGRGEHRGREGSGEHDGREGRGEHGDGERGEHRGRDGRGEHGGGERGGKHGGKGEEEGGKRLEKSQQWNATRRGAHLVLSYDESSQSFKGMVKNTSKKTLSDVRVEVHLSNGVELGPTKRTNLKPGATMNVELSAAGHRFTWWTTHPEHGNEEGHGPGHEGGRRRRPRQSSERREPETCVQPAATPPWRDSIDFGTAQEANKVGRRRELPSEGAQEVTLVSLALSHLPHPFVSALEDPDDNVAWHADDETFVPRSPIASLSLGEERRFKVRHNETKETRNFKPPSGSLLVMTETFQETYQHCVPKREDTRHRNRFPH